MCVWEQGREHVRKRDMQWEGRRPPALVIGHMERQRATVASPSRACTVRPSIVRHTKRRTISDGTGRKPIRRDEQERASTAAHNWTHAVEQRGGGQETNIPDDQWEGIAAQRKAERLSDVLRIIRPHPQQMRQMHPSSSSGRGMEACVRIEQENGVRATDRRQHGVKQRRSAAPIEAGQEMGATERKTTKNGIERFKTRRKDTPHRCEIRSTPERGMGRERGKRRRCDLCGLCLLHHNADLASGSCLLPSPKLCTEYRT